MSPKVFRVAPGYEVVKGYVTYGAGLVLDVEHGETIQVFAAPSGGRGSRVGQFAYDDLAATAPPPGLAAME